MSNTEQRLPEGLSLDGALRYLHPTSSALPRAEPTACRSSQPQTITATITLPSPSSPQPQEGWGGGVVVITVHVSWINVPCPWTWSPSWKAWEGGQPWDSLEEAEVMRSRLVKVQKRTMSEHLWGGLQLEGVKLTRDNLCAHHHSTAPSGSDFQ